MYIIVFRVHKYVFAFMCVGVSTLYILTPFPLNCVR